MVDSPAAAPGWHAAPDGAPYQRWWDGTTWTDHTRPLQEQVAWPQPGRAVTKAPQPTNHILHLLLTVLTCGFWAPVWVFMTLANKASKTKTVTRYS